MEVEAVMMPASDGVGVNGGVRSASTDARLRLGMDGNVGTLKAGACSALDLAGLFVGPRFDLLDVAIGPPSPPEVRFRPLSEVASAEPSVIEVGVLAIRPERLSDMTWMVPGHNRQPLIQGKSTAHHASWDCWGKVTG